MRDTDAYGQWEMEAARRREVIDADRRARDAARGARSTAGGAMRSRFAVRVRATLRLSDRRASQPVCDQRRPVEVR